MTDNRNSEAAWAYHEATKHSYASVLANPHFLDWANQPRPFKIYPALKVLGLPGEVRPTGVAALSAIAQSIPGGKNGRARPGGNSPTALSLRRPHCKSTFCE